MNIEKEFAPYEESLELKELGFDEPCFGYFIFIVALVGGVIYQTINYRDNNIG